MQRNELCFLTENCSIMDELMWWEVRGWYDGIAYWTDKYGTRLSKIAKIPIADDEMCKYGMICKVVKTAPYTYKVLSTRPDIDERKGKKKKD